MKRSCICKARLQPKIILDEVITKLRYFKDWFMNLIIFFQPKMWYHHLYLRIFKNFVLHFEISRRRDLYVRNQNIRHFIPKAHPIFISNIEQSLLTILNHTFINKNYLNQYVFVLKTYYLFSYQRKPFFWIVIKFNTPS